MNVALKWLHAPVLDGGCPFRPLRRLPSPRGDLRARGAPFGRGAGQGGRGPFGAVALVLCAGPPHGVRLPLLFPPPTMTE